MAEVAEIAIAGIVKCVKELWPHSRATPTQIRALWFGGLCRHSTDAVVDALSKQYREQPDDTAPNWKLLRSELGAGASTARNPVEQFCRNWRTAATNDRMLGHIREAAQWSDEQCWMNFVEAQAHSILVNTVTGKRRDDPDGRLAKRANMAKAGECAILLRECRDAGVEPPDWFMRSWMPDTIGKMVIAEREYDASIPF